MNSNTKSIPSEALRRREFIKLTAAVALSASLPQIGLTDSRRAPLPAVPH